MKKYEGRILVYDLDSNVCPCLLLRQSLRACYPLLCFTFLTRGSYLKVVYTSLLLYFVQKMSCRDLPPTLTPT